MGTRGRGVAAVDAALFVARRAWSGALGHVLARQWRREDVPLVALAAFGAEVALTPGQATAAVEPCALDGGGVSERAGRGLDRAASRSPILDGNQEGVRVTDKGPTAILPDPPAPGGLRAVADHVPASVKRVRAAGHGNGSWPTPLARRARTPHRCVLPRGLPAESGPTKASATSEALRIEADLSSYHLTPLPVSPG